MAKIEIRANHAKPNGWGGFSVVFHLDGRPDPLPMQIIETNKAADALAARAKMAEDAKAAGVSCAITMTIREGRAPAGFRKAISEQYYLHVEG